MGKGSAGSTSAAALVAGSGWSFSRPRILTAPGGAEPRTAFHRGIVFWHAGQVDEKTRRIVLASPSPNPIVDLSPGGVDDGERLDEIARLQRIDLAGGVETVRREALLQLSILACKKSGHDGEADARQE
jgi:hypothetical protein